MGLYGELGFFAVINNRPSHFATAPTTGSVDSVVVFLLGALSKVIPRRVIACNIQLFLGEFICVFDGKIEQIIVTNILHLDRYEASVLFNYSKMIVADSNPVKDI